MHRRQLRQESQAALEQPPSEAVVLDAENEHQMVVDYKLSDREVEGVDKFSSVK